MKRFTMIGCTCALILTAGGARGQDDGDGDVIVVTATRTEERLEDVASSVTVIGTDELESQNKPTVLEVLRDVPSVDVVQTAGPGSTTSVFIRGVKSENTLVLVDGVEVNDRMGTGRVYDFSDLDTSGVERVEVIRGPQSTLYGADAMGGVINIITKRGSEEPETHVELSGGTYNSFSTSVGTRGTAGILAYSVNGSYRESEGFSRVGNVETAEADGFTTGTISTNLRLTPSDVFALDVIGRYTASYNDLDDSPTLGGDDPNWTANRQRGSVTVNAHMGGRDAAASHRLSVSYSALRRANGNPTDPAHPGTFSRDWYYGQMSKADWQSNFKAGAAGTLTVGLEAEQEYGNSFYEADWGTSDFPASDADNTAVYLQHQTKTGAGGALAIGLRTDTHSSFGSELTGRVAASQRLDESGTRIRATVGTGFNAPSLYQLYDPFYGDPDLFPERSLGWDVGVERGFADGRGAVGVTYFGNDFDNMIQFNSLTWKYQNVAQAVTEGVEFEARLKGMSGTRASLSYTYLETEDETAGTNLVRRPRNRVGVSLGYETPDRSAGLQVRFLYVGERPEFGGGTLDDYRTVGVSGHINVTPAITATVRVDNLFGEQYEEASGYNTPGCSAFLGLKATL